MILFDGFRKPRFNRLSNRTPEIISWCLLFCSERYMKDIWKIYERYMPLFPCRPQSHLEHLTAAHDHTCQMISNHQRLRPAEGRRRANYFRVPLNLWSLISKNMFLMKFFRSIPWTGSSGMTRDDWSSQMHRICGLLCQTMNIVQQNTGTPVYSSDHHPRPPWARSPFGLKKLKLDTEGMREITELSVGWGWDCLH